MLILIVAGLVYSVLFESLPVAIITASLILYRAQRPSRFLQRARDAWYARAAMHVGDDGE